VPLYVFWIGTTKNIKQIWSGDEIESWEGFAFAP
jgi:alpha-glucosidase (family GH31 glycosyl hydrolase)